jgi:hypothetical protein
MSNELECVSYEVVAGGTEENHEDLSEDNRCPYRDSSGEYPKWNLYGDRSQLFL